MADPAPAVHGIYTPRRPQASPPFRLVSNHLQRLRTVYDDRFAREYGPSRPVLAQVADKFLASGILEHGFARIRCDACAHEYLLAFSCKCCYFCPNCHAVSATNGRDAASSNVTLVALRAAAPSRFYARCVYANEQVVHANGGHRDVPDPHVVIGPEAVEKCGLHENPW